MCGIFLYSRVVYKLRSKQGFWKGTKSNFIGFPFSETNTASNVCMMRCRLAWY
jgi:hypothetical protein